MRPMMLMVGFGDVRSAEGNDVTRIRGTGRVSLLQEFELEISLFCNHLSSFDRERQLLNSGGKRAAE